MNINPVNGDAADRAVAPAIEIDNAAGQLLSASHDGHSIQMTAPATGDYVLKISSANEWKAFLGSFQVSYTETAFAGTMETEPNDTPAAANTLTAPALFGGGLSSVNDQDCYVFTALADDVATIKLANLPAKNPAVRLYDPSGSLLASGRDGNGLAVRLPVDGAYTLVVSADNSAGPVTGEYYGSLVVGDRTVIQDTTASPDQATPMNSMTLAVVPGAYLSQSPGGPAGLTGSYVNAWIGWRTTQDDWRQSQTISGTRVDPILNFDTPTWGSRSQVSITGGVSDADWDLFSTQWDGDITIPTDGTRLYTRSDDASRMWIDINGDGQFDTTGPELVDNHWGTQQAATTGPASVPLAAGTYRIRIQYQEAYGGNIMQLLWDDAGHAAALAAAGPARAAGVLSGMDEVDMFRVNLLAGQTYRVQLDGNSPGPAVADRVIGLYNEFGQLVTYAVNGQIDTNIAQIATGPYLVMVQALNPLGLGAYAVTVSSTGTFPTQRDRPIYYFDFTGYGTYWGHHAAAFTRPDAIPQVIAGFESIYGVYDINIVQDPLPDSVEHVSIGVGHYSDMGGGLGGGMDGSRRIVGWAACDVSDEQSWTRLADASWAFGVTTHEAGHCTGYVPHLQSGRGIMAGDGMYFSIQQCFSGDGGGNLPGRYVYRERDLLDWVTQAGRIGNEIESNDTIATAQDLTPWIAEMSQDADPTNDRAVVLGRIDTPQDVDTYALTVAAGETYALDVDAAEFQYPLDAVLTVLDGSGHVIASNDNAIDRESGIASVDPYLVTKFTQAGTYYVQLSAVNGTFGPYRFKVTPSAPGTRAVHRSTPACPMEARRSTRRDNWSSGSTTSLIPPRSLRRTSSCGARGRASSRGRPRSIHSTPP